MSTGSEEPIFSMHHGDQTLLPMVKNFVGGLPARMSEIKAAIAGGELATVAGLSHKLKGTAGNYGFPLIAQAMDHLEQLALQKVSDESQLLSELSPAEALCRRAAAGLKLTRSADIGTNHLMTRKG